MTDRTAFKGAVPPRRNWRSRATTVTTQQGDRTTSSGGRHRAPNGVLVQVPQQARIGAVGLGPMLADHAPLGCRPVPPDVPPSRPPRSPRPRTATRCSPPPPTPPTRPPLGGSGRCEATGATARGRAARSGPDRSSPHTIAIRDLLARVRTFGRPNGCPHTRRGGPHTLNVLGHRSGTPFGARARKVADFWVLRWVPVAHPDRRC